MATTCYVPLRAKKCNLYLNGNDRHGPKLLVVNPRRVRTWEGFLDQAAQSLKCDRPVHRICTPNNGSGVYNLEEIKDQGNYVVLTSPRFKKLRYLEVQAGFSPKMVTSPRNWDVPPVHHGKYRCSGRIRKIPTDVLKIFIFRNGHPMDRPRMVTLNHRVLQGGWPRVLGELKDSVRETNGYPTKLYTREGGRLTDLNLLENNGFYVLVCSLDIKGFRRGNYGQTVMPFGTGNQRPPVKIYPRYKSETVSYAGKSGYSSSLASTESSVKSTEDKISSETKTSLRYYNERLPRLKNAKSEGQESSASSYPTSTGSEKSNKTRATPKKEAKQKENFISQGVPQKKKAENSVFHAKPIKHKRTPETTRQVDYDKDEGGVFKAKEKNRETADAEEVEENKDTQVDLPIDQVEAETVEEEIEEEEDVSKTHRVRKKKSRTPEPRIPSPEPRSQTPEPHNEILEPRSPTPAPDPKHETKEDLAAVKIQTQVRQFQAKQKVDRLREEKKEKDAEAARAMDESYQEYQHQKEDRGREEQNKAAETIQANYRGHKDREKVKEMQALKKQEVEEDREVTAADEVTDEDEAVEARPGSVLTPERQKSDLREAHEEETKPDDAPQEELKPDDDANDEAKPEFDDQRKTVADDREHRGSEDGQVDESEEDVATKEDVEIKDDDNKNETKPDETPKEEYKNEPANDNDKNETKPDETLKDDYNNGPANE